MFSKHKFHNFREKNYSVQQLLKIPYWLEKLNFFSLSSMAKSIRSGTKHNNKTTLNSHVGVGVGVGIRFSNAVYQLGFNIFTLGALRKFKINNDACTSFKIEKIKLHAFDNAAPPG